MSTYYFDGPDSHEWIVEAESIECAIEQVKQTAFDRLWRAANNHMTDKEYESATEMDWSDPTWQRHRERILNKIETFSWHLAYRGKTNQTNQGA